jgi:hypothetical protein
MHEPTNVVHGSPVAPCLLLVPHWATTNVVCGYVRCKDYRRSLRIFAIKSLMYGDL